MLCLCSRKWVICVLALIYTLAEFFLRPSKSPHPIPHFPPTSERPRRSRRGAQQRSGEPHVPFLRAAESHAENADRCDDAIQIRREFWRGEGRGKEVREEKLFLSCICSQVERGGKTGSLTYVRRYTRSGVSSLSSLRIIKRG